MHYAITTIKSSRQANFTTYQNSIFTDIHFMVEVEKDGVLPFLDVLAHRRNNGELTTSVFRKTPNTLQILSYNSNHPQTDERSRVETLFKRMDTHCITLEAKKKKHVTSSPTVERPSLWQAIPYTANISEAVARLLKPYGIRVAHRPAGKLRSRLMRIKDGVDSIEQSSII